MSSVRLSVCQSVSLSVNFSHFQLLFLEQLGQFQTNLAQAIEVVKIKDNVLFQGEKNWNYKEILKFFQKSSQELFRQET